MKEYKYRYDYIQAQQLREQALEPNGLESDTIYSLCDLGKTFNLSVSQCPYI